MGFGISKQVTLNDSHTNYSRSGSIVFSKEDSEAVLTFETPGTYLLYRDYDTDRLYLSVRSLRYVEHHRINFEDNLYYMDNQPYPYLDSIILYHRKHKLNGTKLTHHAHLSARTVKLFTSKVTAQNGNIPTNRESKAKKQISSASFGAYDRNHVAQEFTNDMVLHSNRISKSSGRLWREGMHESFKRFSMPDTVASLKTFGDATDMNHVTANGHIPGISKSSDVIDNELEELFELDDEFDGGGPLTSRSAVSEPDIVYCSHL